MVYIMILIITQPDQNTQNERKAMQGNARQRTQQASNTWYHDTIHGI